MLTAEQQAVRATGIGGSEIAAVCGLNPWMRPIDVWERKVGRAPPFEETFNTERGRFLEDGLRRWYRERAELRLGRGLDVRPCVDEAGRPTTLRHEKHSIVVATPDGLVCDARTGDLLRVLELKSPNWRTADEWGEPGTDDVPIYYVTQAIWEMSVTAARVADVAPLIDGDLLNYVVDYSEPLFGELFERANRFWVDHVLTGTPPPPDGSDSYGEHIARRFPRTNGNLLIAAPEDDAIAKELQSARAAKDEAERRYNELRQKLELRIGDNDGIAGPDWKVTFREQKGRSSLDQKALAAEAPELVARHTKQGKSFRSFRPTFSQEK